MNILRNDHTAVIVRNAMAILLVSSIVLSANGPDVKQSSSGRPDWLDAMTQVHSRFTGRSGTFAHFGDSITVTLAFWAPLAEVRKNAPAEMERGYHLVQGYMQKECWRDWKGGRFGSEGTRTIRWAHENVDTWLKELNPETALIMFGTNDLNSVGLQEYQAKTRAVVRKCLENGTVVILSTIPPRHGFAEKATAYAQAVREIAHQMRVPLVDLHSEILKRRPEDWDGATDKFAEYNGYDVPTLLARDGVHLSHPKQYQDDYSPEALDRCGYSLRNYLVLIKYVEVLKGLGRIPGVYEGISDSGSGSSQEKAIQPPEQGWFPKAPSLPRLLGLTVEVSDVPQLIGAIREARPGQTILVRDGHYMMPHYVQITADNVTLRGASGRRERVIIDGAQSRDGELLGVRACSGVTIADLTIQNVKWNGFKINSETNVQKLTIFNCIIHNIWQRGIKGVKVPQDNRDAIRPKQCRVQYCLFYNDRPKRLSDDAADIAQGNYVGGIDAMYAKDWIISDNVFVGIQGRTHEGRGAIFIWHDSQDCVIERNIIIDCDVGLHLGNPHRPDDVQYHCVGFITRNNFITRAPEAGIVAVYTKDCKVLNNTVHDPQSRMGRLIRTVFANDGLVIANNLLDGPGIRNESESSITFHNNLIGDFTRALANPGAGDLHLNRTEIGALGRGAAMAEVAEDIDGQRRESKPDIGADELMN